MKSMRTRILLKVAKATAAITVLNGTLACVGYAVGSPHLYHWPVADSAPMALSTALGFIAVGITMVAVVIVIEDHRHDHRNHTDPSI